MRSKEEYPYLKELHSVLLFDPLGQDLHRVGVRHGQILHTQTDQSHNGTVLDQYARLYRMNLTKCAAVRRSWSSFLIVRRSVGYTPLISILMQYLEMPTVM